MPLVDKVRSLFGRGERTFSYECTNCDHVFESPHASMAEVSCPECSETRVVTASPGTA